MSNTAVTLVNGQAVDYISVTDRGFAYGDGIFETIAIANKKPCLWEKHLNRLSHSCNRLGINFNKIAQLEDEVFQLSKKADPYGVVKIIISRGGDALGYKIASTTEPSHIVQFQDRQTFSEVLYRQGITACFCKQRLSHNPTLSGIKHLCRLEQVLARMEWQDEYHEGIMFDYQNNAIEGTMSNLFVLNDAIIKTPRLDNCGVRGVMREWILEQCEYCNIMVEETKIDRQAILEADGLFFSNALIRIWPVHYIEDRCYDINIVHELMRQFTFCKLGIVL